MKIFKSVKIIFITGLILAAAVLTSYGRFVAKESGTPMDARIKTFNFGYSGTILGIMHSYDVQPSDSGHVFKFGIIKPQKSYELDENFMSSLELLCREHHVEKWNGFDSVVKELYDGEGFSLYIEFDDGKTISAEGYGKFPEGYFEFKSAVIDLFDPLIEE